MKTIRIQTRDSIVLVHAPDEVVELKVGRRTYIMEWCKSLGPTFYFKNDNPYFPSHRAPIWKAFSEWMEKNR